MKASEPKFPHQEFNAPKELLSFNNLLNFLSKDNLENEALNRGEDIWENIPLVIPKSVLVLEKNLKRVQDWCQYAQTQIDIVFAGTLTQDIRDELQNQKHFGEQFKEHVEFETKNIMKKIGLINAIERKRELKEIQERAEESFFDKFFEQEKEPIREPKENKFISMLLEENTVEDYEEPRRYNLKQLHFLIYRLLNKSCLNAKVVELIDEIKSVEDKLQDKMNKQYEDLNFKCTMLDSKIMLEKAELRKELEKKDEEIMGYVNDQVLTRVIDNENVTDVAVMNIEELKVKTTELTKFKETTEQRFDQITKQNDDFYDSFERKILFYDDNFEFMKNKTEEKLKEFHRIIENKYEKLKQQNDEQIEMIKGEFFNFFEENNQRNFEAVEKLLAKNVVQMQNYDVNTKQILEEFQEKMNIFNSELNKKNINLKGKLDTFISKFEAYSKLKIEPMVGSEAKIHALELRCQEQEEFFSYATLFTKDILKKFIYAIQKHNIGNIKLIEEEELPREKRTADPAISFLTDIKDVNLSFFEPLSGEDSPHVRRSSQSQARRNLYNVAIKKGADRSTLPSINIETNTSSSRKQGFDIQPNSTKPRKRKQSFDIDKLPNKKKEEGSSKHGEFDDMLHRRLEVLRKKLIEETRISQNYSNAAAKEISSQIKTPQEKEIPSKKTVLSFYQNVDLVRVTADGAKKRKSVNRILNKTVPEFNDNHLSQENQLETEC